MPEISGILCKYFRNLQGEMIQPTFEKNGAETGFLLENPQKHLAIFWKLRYIVPMGEQIYQQIRQGGSLWYP